MPKAIVIGAGFGGIAAALRLRRKGYDVTLLDKQDKLGGRAYQYERKTPLGTFIHDAGPTVVTAKFLFDELFEMFGKKREDYIEFRDIFPWYRIVFAGQNETRSREGLALTHGGTEDWSRRREVEEKGREKKSLELSSSSSFATSSLRDHPYFDYGGTIEQMEAQIRAFGGDEDVEGFRKYLKHSKKIFDVGFTELGSVPFHKFGTMMKCAPDLLRLQNYKTVWGMAKKYIKNDSLRRVFSFQPLLVGGNPFNTTSIYSLIFYLEREWGVQFAMGGTGAIVRGLEKLMREEGVEINLDEEVTSIDTTPSRRMITPITDDPNAVAKALKNSKSIPYARRVQTDRRTYSMDWRTNDLIVCNADAPMVYSKLLDPKYRKGVAARRIDSKLAPQKYSMGLFVLYFGTKKPYPEIAHHTIVLGESYRELIDTLFDAREIETKDLSVYLHRPTATDPSMAPAGCESFYVLVPVPNLQPKKRSMTVPVMPHERDAHAAQEIPITREGVIDWSRYGDTFLAHVLDYLERTVLPGLRETIVDPFYVTPEHFKNNLNSMHGAGFSIQPIFSQSAWFRFHNKAPGIEGLYFVGAGTHPGAGMPGVLCSAKVLEHLIPDVKR